jgi:hypothetical protein
VLYNLEFRVWSTDSSGAAVRYRSANKSRASTSRNPIHNRFCLALTCRSRGSSSTMIVRVEVRAAKRNLHVCQAPILPVACTLACVNYPLCSFRSAARRPLTVAQRVDQTTRSTLVVVALSQRVTQRSDNLRNSCDDDTQSKQMHSNERPWRTS